MSDPYMDIYLVNLPTSLAQHLDHHGRSREDEKNPVQLPCSSTDPWGLWIDSGQMSGGRRWGGKTREAWPSGHSPKYLVAKGCKGAPDKQGEIVIQ